MPRPNKIWFRKDTGWWMVTIHGKKVRLAKGRKNRKEAQKKFHELMAVRHESPDTDDPFVADLIEAFLAYAKKRFSPDTYRNYRFYGQRFAEHCGKRAASQLKPFHITRWIDKHTNWNQTTERNARRLAHRVMTWSKEEGLVANNPLAGMKCPAALTRKRSLTYPESRAMIAASHGPLRILFWALFQTGARPSEARSLTWDQVRSDRWVLQSHKTVKKTQKPRVVYLNPPMQRLMKHLKERSTSRHVFVNSRGKPWTTNALRYAMDRTRQRANLSDDVCAYLIRHTFGTRAIVNGCNSSTVAELMGHSSTEMIDRVYVHLADQVEHLQDAVARATKQPHKKDG